MSGSHWLSKVLPLLNGTNLIAHAVASCRDPDGVVDKPFHVRLGMDAGAEPLVPVLPQIQRAEHSRAAAARREIGQQAEMLPDVGLRLRPIHRRQD